MNLISKLIALLSAIADLIQQWRKLREQAQHEQSLNELEQDPPKWFDSHFNGDSSDYDANSVRNHSTMPNDAASTQQAPPTEHNNE